MKRRILDIILCDRCGGDFIEQAGALGCPHCGRRVPLQDGIPLFTSPPAGMQPSEKLARGPEIGTPWRRANWRFLEAQVAALDPHATILDVGAGRGDFSGLFRGWDYLALDVYPYPEVDLVCDLTRTNPFREGSLDAILLMNVLEHVYDVHALMDTLVRGLKSGGVMIVAIPFLVKMHQEPVDFARYTHYALERLGKQYGLELLVLEGYYDPLSLLGEGTGNLKNAVLPELRSLRHYAGRLLLLGIEGIASILGRVIGPGKAISPETARSHAPTGYQLVYRKTI